MEQVKLWKTVFKKFEVSTTNFTWSILEHIDPFESTLGYEIDLNLPFTLSQGFKMEIVNVLRAFKVKWCHSFRKITRRLDFWNFRISGGTLV